MYVDTLMDGPRDGHHGDNGERRSRDTAITRVIPIQLATGFSRRSYDACEVGAS